jgi:hypothetical protein
MYCCTALPSPQITLGRPRLTFPGKDFLRRPSFLEDTDSFSDEKESIFVEAGLVDEEVGGFLVAFLEDLQSVPEERTIPQGSHGSTIIKHCRETVHDFS